MWRRRPLGRACVESLLCYAASTLVGRRGHMVEAATAFQTPLPYSPALACGLSTSLGHVSELRASVQSACCKSATSTAPWLSRCCPYPTRPSPTIPADARLWHNFPDSQSIPPLLQPPGDCVAARNPNAGHRRLRRTLRTDWAWCGAGGCRVPSGFKCIRCFAELGGHGRKWKCGCAHIFRVHEPLAPAQSFLPYLLCLGRSFLQNSNPHFSPSFLLQLSIHLECLPAA
jgi:hypothetical protein